MTERKSTAGSGMRARRVLCWIGIVLAVSIGLMVGVLSWALQTESGARFVLAHAESALGGKLAVKSASGTLAGPLMLNDVHYRDAAAGIDATVARVSVDIAPLALLAERLHVENLVIGGVNVALTTVPPKPQAPSQFSPSPPIDVVLDRLALTQAGITRDGKPLFAADRLDLAGAWTGQGIAIRQLKLRSSDGSVDLDGTVATEAGYAGQGTARFEWKAADVKYAGTLKAGSDGRQAEIALALTEPTPATLTGTLVQQHALPWTIKLDVPEFDPNRVHKHSSLKSLALALSGSGDRAHGRLSGGIVVDRHRVELDPLRYSLTEQRLLVDALTLKSPQTKGVVHATGAVELDADPISATLALNWDGVELPADLVGQALATHGKIDASGSANAYRAKGALAIGPPGQLADLALELEGTPREITLDKLALKQARGGLEAHGTITVQPQIGWRVAAAASKLDPGAFAADWPGAIDLHLTSAGTLTDHGPDATIKLDKLGGTLRQRPLSGHADVTIKPGYLVDGTLALASGDSRVDVVGQGGDKTDATIKLAIASLGDWLPNADGRANAEFRVHGRWPDLAIVGHASASRLAFGGSHIDALDLAANVSKLKTPQGSVHVEAREVTTGGFVFDRVTLDANGNQKSHHLTLDADGADLGTRLALDGSATDAGQWQGTLKKLILTPRDVPRFALQQPAQFNWDGRTFHVGEICLAADGPKICVAGTSGTDGSLQAHYRIDELPLALIARISAPDAPIRISGTIGGRGDIQRAADGALEGHATLNSANGDLAYTDHATEPLLAYTGLAVNAELSPQSTHATVRAALDHDGRLAGDVTLTGAPGSAQNLSGRIDLTLNSLAFVELLTTEVANTKGHVEAHYTLAGTTSAPRFDGALALKDLAAEIPSAGLKLHDGDVSLKASDPEHFVLDGRISSGKGTVKITGSGGLGATSPLKATLSGENFLAADIPAARVVISPDLTIERSAERVSIGGKVTIPKAKVDLAKLPGGGVGKTSPDVVVVDEKRARPGAPLPVFVQATVNLGDDVQLAGLGLDGKIAGQLAVNDTPGKVTIGTGTLNVSGTYKAYGQDLTIQSGRLLFAGTAIDNPGLDISAVRKIRGEDITAGLKVRGTAQVPILTVFSDPTMEQSEALSYLVTGKPLSQLNSGEGSMLGTAAKALGTAGGDLLAKGLGSRLGVEAGVSDNAALGGAAFTVGKYLSPKLYLSYGVGVFDPGQVVTLRYLINKRFNFETQNATTGNRAGINYRYEK
ncbi:MAG: translocation/assembly module TamB domain-containing protein [Rhodanobacteraceae bacterium]